MPRVEQTEQPRGTSTSSYSETYEQKQGWGKLADWIEQQCDEGLLIQGDTFKVKGYVAEMNLDNGKFFTKTIKVKNRQTGAEEEKQTTHTQSIAVIDDRRFTPEGTLLPLPPKQLGTSFFDGRMRDGSRGIARGAMYHLHLAVTFQEPPADLVNNRGGWDTDDYTGPNHPVLLLVDFAGWEQEGSQYYNSRAGLKVFLNRFERDPEARTASPKPTTRTSRSSGRSSTESQPANPATTATERVPDLGLTGDDFEDAPEGEHGPNPTSTTPARRSASGATAPAGDAPPTGRGRSRATSASAGAGAKAAVGHIVTTSVDSGPVKVIANPADPALQKATERQVRFIATLLGELGERVPDDLGTLTRKQASERIEELQRLRNAAA